MKSIQLNGVKRTDFGKKSAKDIRRAQMVPCIIYGGENAEVHFSVEAKSLKQLLYTPNSYIVEFDIEGSKEVGVLREAQFHPVKEYCQHLDFYRVLPGKPVAIDVPVKITGNSEGVKAGGKLNVSRRKLRISALAEYLPDEIVVDITELGLGKSISCSDLNIENVTILTPASAQICNVLATRASRSAEAAEE
ncbi:MAG: 50S ribosomal protein L25/general stress protein Ctc [Tidjanibacter sp.]|nr:50S ribosomal protein L25/general stress protein Ctc [Tidjanibacter sp.]